MPSTRTFGLIPAAGLSTRMGRPKLTLLLGGRTVLEQVIDAVRKGGVPEILVVVAPEAQDLTSVAVRAGAHVLELTEPTADMRATVEHGLRWLQDRFQPSDDDSWLLLPADHPTLEAAVVQSLLREWAVRREKSIFVPTFEGRRGHPALIGWKHVLAIRAMPPGAGLNQYVRGCASEVQEVPVDFREVLCDLDTPEDYRKLQQNEPRPSGSGAPGYPAP